MPPKTHDVGADAERMHAGEGDKHADRQREDGNERAARMQKKEDAHGSNDQAFLDERAGERMNGAPDQLRTVVDRGDLHAFGQGGLKLIELLLDVADGGECVRAVALDGNAAHDLALPVHLGDAAPLVRPELDARHVAQQHRRAGCARLEHDRGEILEAAQIAAAADHIFGFGELDGAAADILVAAADGLA